MHRCMLEHAQADLTDTRMSLQLFLLMLHPWVQERLSILGQLLRFQSSFQPLTWRLIGMSLLQR